MRLNHVALTVSDREKSAEFYAHWCGMVKRMHEDNHLLILSNQHHDYLALSEGEVPPQPPRTTHFGFMGKNGDEVRTMREALHEAGVEEVEWQEEGTVRVQFLDPDGYRVDFYAFDWA